MVDFDLRHRRVILKDGETAYDTLIVATGARHHYFGHDEWEPLAPRAEDDRGRDGDSRRFLMAFEAAEREPDPEKRRQWLTFRRGRRTDGGGTRRRHEEIASDTFKENFRSFNPDDAKIFLVEGADRVLPPYSPELSAKAEQALKKLGVTFLAGSVVTDVAREFVTIRRGDSIERIATRSVFGGQSASVPLGKKLAAASNATTDRMGRVYSTRPILARLSGSVRNQGMAPVRGRKGGPASRRRPGREMQQRNVCGVNARVKGAPPPEPFRYKNLGMMATIGRHAAVIRSAR
ncbi:MAG: hypothetical protein U1D30_17050 [Planctomycetota bacterium]